MDFFPKTEMERQYVNTTTSIIVALAIIIVVLLAVLITVLCFYLKYRKNQKVLKQKESEQVNTDLLENERQVLSEYRELDSQGKELIDNTLQTLNSKSHKS